MCLVERLLHFSLHHLRFILIYVFVEGLRCVWVSVLYSYSVYCCHIYFTSFPSVTTFPLLIFMARHLELCEDPVITLISLYRSLVLPILLLSSTWLHFSFMHCTLSCLALLWKTTIQYNTIQYNTIQYNKTSFISNIEHNTVVGLPAVGSGHLMCTATLSMSRHIPKLNYLRTADDTCLTLTRTVIYWLSVPVITDSSNTCRVFGGHFNQKSLAARL